MSKIEEGGEGAPVDATEHECPRCATRTKGGRVVKVGRTVTDEDLAHKCERLEKENAALRRPPEVENGDEDEDEDEDEDGGAGVGPGEHEAGADADDDFTGFGI